VSDGQTSVEVTGSMRDDGADQVMHDIRIGDVSSTGYPSLDILVRRPRAEDAPAIAAMFARCSLASRYGRFHAPLPTIPAADLERIVVPRAGEEAWIGVTRDDPETVVALGNWARRGDDAEVALIVEDAWQRQGIGSTFLGMLAERAWSAGVCRLRASVLRESRHVLRMLRAVLGATSMSSDGSTTFVTIERP
jgi:GNAT superfamily N-acetyltransferase